MSDKSAFIRHDAPKRLWPPLAGVAPPLAPRSRAGGVGGGSSEGSGLAVFSASVVTERKDGRRFVPPCLDLLFPSRVTKRLEFIEFFGSEVCLLEKFFEDSRSQFFVLGNR